MNSVQKQYFQEIEHRSPCSTKIKKRCIIALEDSVYSFIENNPNATLNNLYDEFGTPNSIAESFVECLNPKDLSKRLSVKRKTVFGIIGVVVVLAIVIGIVVISHVDTLQDYRDGYAVEAYYELSPDASPSSKPFERY